MSRRDMFGKVVLTFTLVSTLANAQQFSSLRVWTNVSCASANRIDTRVAMPETDWCRLL